MVGFCDQHEIALCCGDAMRIDRLVCKSCGKSWEIGLPSPRNCLVCGSERTTTTQRLVRHCNTAYCDGEYILSTSAAADILKIDEGKVLELCENGFINSILDWTLSNEPLRSLFVSDVERFSTHGPNRLMSFDEAMAFIAIGPKSPEPETDRLVRRSSWPGQSSVGRDDTYLAARPPVTRSDLRSSMSEKSLVKLNRARAEVSDPLGVVLYASYPSLVAGPYRATDEDRREADWFELLE
jgi:hypothetical protein